MKSRHLLCHQLIIAHDLNAVRRFRPSTPAEGWCSGCSWWLPFFSFECTFSLPPKLTLPPGQSYAAAPPETSWHIRLPSLLLQDVVCLCISQLHPLRLSCCAWLWLVTSNFIPDLRGQNIHVPCAANPSDRAILQCAATSAVPEFTTNVVGIRPHLLSFAAQRWHMSLPCCGLPSFSSSLFEESEVIPLRNSLESLQCFSPHDINCTLPTCGSSIGQPLCMLSL